MLKIVGFTISLLMCYIIKRYLIQRIKHKKIIYLDVLMFTLKMVYMIIFLETEYSLFQLLLNTELNFDNIFYFIGIGLKITLIESSFLVNYFRWITKTISILFTCFYVSFRIMDHISFQISSIFMFSFFIICIIIKIEKQARQFFKAHEEQGSFLSNSDHFKYIFENLQERIIEKFFNKSSEGFLFIDKEFKSFHHNNKINQFFSGSSIIPCTQSTNQLTNTKAKTPIHIQPVNDFRTVITNAANESLKVNFNLNNESRLGNNDSNESNCKSNKHHSPSLKNCILTNNNNNEKGEKIPTSSEGRTAVDRFFASKLIGLKEGPEFLHKFFIDNHLKIFQKNNSSLNMNNNHPTPNTYNSNNKKGLQSSISLENFNSVPNLIQKYSNMTNLQMLLNFFIKRKNKDKNINSSSFNKFHTSKFSTANNIIQEEDCHALVEIACLYFDESKQIFKEKLFEVMVFPIFKTNEITHFFFLVQDLGLETIIKQLTLENENKSKALAFVSHEMRTPLNCTKGMLQMLKEVTGQEYLDAYVLPAITSAEFLLNLLNDLLDISQIQNGKFRLIYLEFNLKVLLLDILSMIRPHIISRGIKLFFNYDDRIPELIKSDANRIRQIVTNLIGNAIKFTKKGSISVYASLEPKDNTLLLIQVVDTGLGIKDENKEKLFQAFGKVDSDENEYLNSQGVGLGLLISNMLAKNLGPSISKLKKLNMNAGLNMTSKYGDGTTFKFIIEDKNETDVISKESRVIALIGPPNETKLIEFVNHQTLKNKIYNSKESLENEINEENDKEIDKDNQMISSNPCRRLVTSESVKRKRKTRSFIPLNSINNQDFKTTFTNPEKKPIVNYKTLVINDYVSYSPKTIRKNIDTEPHLETDEEIIKKIMLPCENNCPKILICDDDYFNLVVLENFLQEFKVKLEKAYNGEEAIEKVKNQYFNSKCCKSFQLIFMDIEMPEKNGLEACREIINFFEMNNEKSPIIIATTGHTEQEEMMKITESGMNASISKPISRKELTKIMKKTLLMQQGNE